MDKIKPMYVDAVTGTYGEQKDLIMVDLNAAERYYFEEDMTGPEIIEYCKARVESSQETLCSCRKGPKLGKRVFWAMPRCGRCRLMVSEETLSYLRHHELRAQAFEEVANEMDRLVAIMKEQQERVKREGQPDWPGGYIADREGHAIWLRKWAALEREKMEEESDEPSWGLTN